MMEISTLFYKSGGFFLDMLQAKGSLQRSPAPLCCGHWSVSCYSAHITEYFLHCSFSPLKPGYSSQTGITHVLLELLSHIG